MSTDVTPVINEAETQASIERVRKRYRSYNLIFGVRELLDRLSYGFAGYQFITILFFLTGASAFIVSLITALRDIIVTLVSSILNDYSKVHDVGKQFIANAGIIYGFSFFGILLALRIQSVWLFAISLLVGSVGVVTYGELYIKLMGDYIPHERRSYFLQKASHFGLLITAAAFFVTGIILELFQADKATTIFGINLPVSGSFLVFEVTAILCIIAGYLLSQLPKQPSLQNYSFKAFRKEYWHQVKVQTNQFLGNKYLVFLLIGAVLVSIIQSLGASFYGYHIFTAFKGVAAGGFINIAIIFTVAILVSFLGPWLANWLKRHIGLAPLFVFATLLMAMLPLALVFNPYFITVLVATSLSVLGASLLGISQSLLVRKLLFASERKLFFQSSAVLTVIPVLILVPVGGLLAQSVSFLFLFKIMVGILVFIVAPLYFILVLLSHRKKL